MINFGSAETKCNLKRAPRGALLAAVTATALGLAGCTIAQQAPDPKPQQVVSTKPHPAKPKPHHTKLVPDMRGFLKPGTEDTCFNGGPRPCAILLRAQPKLAADYVNVTPEEVIVPWPLEAYGSSPGDQLEVVCFDPTGQEITSFEDNFKTTVWYKVIVPLKRVPEVVRHELHDTTSPVYAYASAAWFAETMPQADVPKC